MKIIVLVLLVSATIGLEPEVVIEDTVKISEEGIQLICQFEGFKEHPYLDIGGVPTIGYGTAFYDNKTRVTLSDPPISQSEAVTLLESSVNDYCKAIDQLVTTTLTQNQFDALCSFSYNLGITAFKNSTLLSLINNSNFQAAADEFLKWDHDNGVVVPGLLKRRQEERMLFMKGGLDVAAN